MAGASAPLFVASTLLKLHIPLVLDALFLAAGILWIGYGVVRYSAFLDGRVAPRDFVYQAAAIGAVALIYLAVTWFSVATYRVPGAAFTFIVVLAIITHSLVGSGRSHFDWLFFRSEALHLRRSFRRLAMLAGERESLEDRLRRPLEALCRSVSATYGLIYLDTDGQASAHASFGWSRTSPPAVSFSRLAADDLESLRPGYLPAPLADVCLLAPLYHEAHQLGALLLGCPRDALGFNEADLDLIAQASDRLAATIENAREQEIHLHQIEALVESDAAPTASRELNIRAIESALRNLFDFAYLGNHPLAQRLSLQRYLPGGEVTHLERGRALHNRIADAIEHFRPRPDQPSDPPPREWYPYLILRSAYLDGTPNRDIMARLYISEGTFNRTRRAAVHALAIALEESEAAMLPAAHQPDRGEVRSRNLGTAPAKQLAASGSDASGTGVSVRRRSVQDPDDP
jgi:GAF domain-containing protein